MDRLQSIGMKLIDLLLAVPRKCHMCDIQVAVLVLLSLQWCRDPDCEMVSIEILVRTMIKFEGVETMSIDELVRTIRATTFWRKS